MLKSISPQLRKAGKQLADLGKEIEDSQVEDGDPPFNISYKQMRELTAVATELGKIIKSVTTEEADQDYGEDPLGLRPGHEDE